MGKQTRVYFILFFFVFLLNSIHALPQNTIADSLRNAVKNQHGEEKVSTQLDLALEILTNRRDEALALGNSALLAAQKLGSKELEMRSFYILGRAHVELRNYKLAKVNFDSALQISMVQKDDWTRGDILFRVGVAEHRSGEYLEALKSFNEAVLVCRKVDNFSIMGSAYSMMGTIFRMNGLYDGAIEYIIKSRLNYEKAGYTEGDAWANYLLGRIYSDLKLPEEAMLYFQQALKTYNELAAINKDNKGIAICLEQIGLLNIEFGNYPEARKSLEKTWDIYSAEDNKYGMQNAYKNFGILEYSMKNYSKAEENLNKALELRKQVNDKLGLPVIYEYLGLSKIAQEQKKVGFEIIQEGLDLAILNDQKKIQQDIYSKLTEAYLKANDLKKAIESQNKQIEIQNQILSGSANIKTNQLHAIYEIDEKNGQIAELEKQNTISELELRQQQTLKNIMIISIILALVVVAIISTLYRKLRKNNIQLHETNAAKDKFFTIIAHDLRGPTSAMTALLEELNSNFDESSIQERKEILAILSQSARNVGQLLENLLLWARSQGAKIRYNPIRINLSEGIELGINGLKQIAQNKGIVVAVEKKNSTFILADPDMFQTIIRNIVGNAIKFTHRNGLISIQYEIENYFVRISVKDNGVGIEKSKLDEIFSLNNAHHTRGTENEMSTGLGLILVKDFVEKNKGTVSITSEKGVGTTVTISLPLA